MFKFQQTVLVKDGLYNSFPSVTRAHDGSIILVYRQADNSLKTYGAVTHVDASSRIAMKISRDNGASWSDSTVIYNDEMGENDPCINTLSDGTLICTFFRWKVVPKEEKASLGEAFTYFGRILFDRWAAIHVGTSCIRSSDNGKTWDGPWHFSTEGYQGPAAMRGNVVELPDKTLCAPLYAVKRFGQLSRCLIVQSKDKGKTWNFLGEIPSLNGHHFLEPFLYRAPSGRLDILMRTQLDFFTLPFDETYKNLHTSSSFDGGVTWNTPEPTNMFCPNPVHMLSLDDNRVMATFGQRRDPKGIEALITDSEHPIFSDSGVFQIRPAVSGDLGYTSAVLLDHNTSLIVYYMTDVDNDACIGATVMEGFDGV
ncbi:MAG: sialidase family protein [Sphaerochaetaceae bacterium]|jgi:hypothetical protein|nr:glycoside hydrolase [Sphaerochaetaceae bacterium]MDD3670847.1 sialidase family protein [Sphaerochaetaceae bacterium]MDD4260550.1 sialidase family protein [Sphaerochaetaceae bacterium]MDD4841596.1 sialidase family protein [Sphaerochaetaceae bacterium]NLO61033.1 exo-alpha-sialidase [Spirochaetales bacterium]